MEVFLFVCAIIGVALLAWIAESFAQFVHYRIIDIKEEKEYNELYKEQFEKVFNTLVKNKKLYHVYSRWEKQEKCNACDDNRNITVNMPDGSTTKISCSCSKHKTKFYIEELDKELTYIFNRNGNVSIGFYDHQNNWCMSYLIATYDEAVKWYQSYGVYKKDYTYYCFKSKKDAEMFKKWVEEYCRY